MTRTDGTRFVGWCVGAHGDVYFFTYIGGTTLWVWIIVRVCYLCCWVETRDFCSFRLTANIIMFTCACGKAYATERGRRDHERRYCRGAPGSGSSEKTCQYCQRDFASYMAMRKHLSVAHPQQYNHELYVETESTNRRQLWTDGELEEMSRLEVVNQIFLNTHGWHQTSVKLFQWEKFNSKTRKRK